MSETTALIHDLVDASIEGAAFYEEASVTIGDRKLREAFSEMSKAKSSLAQNLSAELGARPKRHSPDDALAQLGAAYDESRGGLAKASGASLTTIEQTERVVQKALERVVLDRDNNYVVRVHAKLYAKRAEDFASLLRRRMRETGKR